MQPRRRVLQAGSGGLSRALAPLASAAQPQMQAFYRFHCQVPPGRGMMHRGLLFCTPLYCAWPSSVSEASTGSEGGDVESLFGGVQFCVFCLCGGSLPGSVGSSAGFGSVRGGCIQARALGRGRDSQRGHTARLKHRMGVCRARVALASVWRHVRQDLRRDRTSRQHVRAEIRCRREIGHVAVVADRGEIRDLALTKLPHELRHEQELRTRFLVAP
jgi:hypothetical protein